MHGEAKSGMQCLEFDALLSDALDGILSPRDRERFEAHRAACPSCGPAFAEAQTGLQLLHGLTEVAPPANFVHNILVATTGQSEAAAAAERPQQSWWTRFKESVRPVAGPLLHPKVAMSVAMVFFSISLVLNLAGVKLSNINLADFSPNSIMRGAYEAQGRMVKYYENLRFVYEIESRVQELKRATTPEEGSRPAEKERNRKDHSGNPDPERYRNYSREQEAVTMARQFETAPLHDQLSARRNP